MDFGSATARRTGGWAVTDHTTRVRVIKTLLPDCDLNYICVIGVMIRR